MGSFNITPEKFETLLEYVEKLKEIPPNWNEHGAFPADDIAIERAKRLVFFLKEHRLLRYMDLGYDESNKPTFYIPDEEHKKDILDEINNTKNTAEKSKLLRHLEPEIDFGFLTISLRDVGDIEFFWGCDIAFAYITIPSQSYMKISYECGYVDEHRSPPEYIKTDDGKTNDYDWLAEFVKENISHCF